MLRTSLTQSAENLLLLVNMAGDAEVGVGGGDYEDETNKRSLHSKNLNKTIGYLTPNANRAFI